MEEHYINCQHHSSDTEVIWKHEHDVGSTLPVQTGHHSSADGSATVSAMCSCKIITLIGCCFWMFALDWTSKDFFFFFLTTKYFSSFSKSLLS